MAAGPGAASSGHGGGRGSSAALESSLDRRFQGVTNTMESIQGLSSWCIENKKHHSLIVRYWMKWLKKSDANHRLNLFYLANDVIQNCKRKNAIVYRTTFADVLPDAALLVKDAKVCKSVDRIFSIWQERNVYPEELISELKTSLQKREKEKEKEKEKEPPPPAPVNPKSALKSKIVAEFVPHDFIEHLASYKHSLEESDLREKQLAALRVDVCSTEALKRLKDKAGGNKFSKDFEEGSSKLQEFVTFLEGQMKAGPTLLEVLGNADIFYEMQYKEVKIVANAYKAFANRVCSLKRKLDALKSNLPSLDDSPIPSPSEDAPSPTGSESPFHGMISRTAVGTTVADGEKGLEQQTDNRDIEDMDMSEEEEANTGIIVDDRKEKLSLQSVSKATNAAATKSSQITTSKPPQTLATPTKTVSGSVTNQTPPANATPVTCAPAPVTVVSPSPLQVNLANVDLGKISSILSSISNAMKTTGVSPVSRRSPGTPTTSSSHASTSKALPSTPGNIPSSNPLASILSKVDISPESILNVLTKTQAHSSNLHGLSSLLSSARSGCLGTPDPLPSSSTLSSAVAPTVTSSTTTPTIQKTVKPIGNNFKRESDQEKGQEWEEVKEREREKEREQERKEKEKQSVGEATVSATALPSLESKINSFLQGNPGFSALGLGLDDVGSNSPLLVGGDNLDGTPVRDESGSTPTQDEIMDTPHVLNDPQNASLSGGHNLSPTAYHSDPWDAVITPRGVLGENEGKDRDYRKPPSSRLAVFNPNAAKPAKAMTKTKEEEGLKRKLVGQNIPLGPIVQEQKIKVKIDGTGGKNVASRRPSIGEDAIEKKVSADNGEHYHRIETLVSSASNEGAPIETLDYGNRIQTVESIRVIGRGLRRGSSSGPRVGGAWYEEEEFMDAPPPHHSGSHGSGSSDELGLVPPPLPPTHLPPPLQYPPPPYANEVPIRPSHTHAIPQHPPPPPFFSSPSISAVPPPLPPIPQAPPPPRDFPLSPTSSVMVGGVLVPIDRVLPFPPANLRSDGMGCVVGSGSSGPPRGSKPQLPSLLGEPPRPGTVKEQFALHHAPPLHRPGTPGVPPPLLGRVREGPSPTPPSPSTPTTPIPPSPAGEPRPLLSIPNHIPINNPNQRPHRPSSPQPLLRLPSQHRMLGSPHVPRGPLPPPPSSLNRESLMHGAKRPAASFNSGPFHPPKRPFLPPRY